MWPTQVGEFPEAAYLTLPGFAPGTSFDLNQAATLVASKGTGVVVAASFGAVVAAHAARITAPRGLLLAEPALYALARGGPAVEALIDRMDPIYRRDISSAQFWAQAMTVLTGTTVAEPADAAGQAAAQRFRSLGAPWDYPVDAAFPAGIPTVVVTGEWNPEYEEIAAALAVNGARHVRLPGFGHRVADHPGFNDVARALLDEVR
jgi:hypothetical protein